MNNDSNSTATIEAANVSKRFGSEEVLRNLDLTVETGDITLLMGPNGVGKSVFMSCLAGSTAPDEGTIELFEGLSPVEARPAISLMLQGEMTDPDLTGRENLQFYANLHPHGTDRWRELTENLEMTDDLDRLVSDYSGGMQRKIEIAITLSTDVPLYLFDEPTAELDLSMIRVFHDTLLEMKETGKTIVVTSHAPLDTQIADRIAFMQAGQIVADGTPTELLNSLPRVLRTRGAVPSEKQLVGNQMFRRGDEVRGFLPEDRNLTTIKSELETTAEDPLVDIDPPSYTDAFNYYTYIHAPTEIADGSHHRLPGSPSRQL